MATLSLPSRMPSPRDDAYQIYNACKGWGCDTAAIVNILAHRHAEHRRRIAQEYDDLYQKDLYKRLTSELGGDLEKAVMLWMPDPGTRDAIIVKKNIGSDLKVATEVICSRTPAQVKHFKEIYQQLYEKSLEDDVRSEASGHHKQLLLAYIYSDPDENEPVDEVRADSDAAALYQAGERKFGTDEDTFIRIFTESSRAHLAAVGASYKKIYGKKLSKAVKSETSGNFEFALLCLLKCAENSSFYFAKVLYKAMKGFGTDDVTLIRIIVTRAEIDLAYIKIEYEKKYKKSLKDAVHSETSSHYRTFLLALIN